MEGFKTEVIDNIIPFIEENYRVITDADHRALADLSMGGGQTFEDGLQRAHKGVVDGVDLPAPEGQNGEITVARKFEVIHLAMP